MFDGLDEFRDGLDDDLLAIANDNLADADICELAGVEQIDDVRSLALVVKTTDGNSVLGDLGTRVPQLSSLKLSGSQIASIRDLGTSWANLHVLWLARCGLHDIDGLHALHGLRELYLAFNDIVDLSGMVALEQLTVLDLEANKVSDLGQIEFLAGCAELTDLTLQHNPAAMIPTYRATVCARLAQLCTLDEREVTPADRAAPRVSDDATAAPHAARDVGRAGDGAAAPVERGEHAGEAGATDALAEMRRELQLVMDGVKYAQVEGLTAGIGAAGSLMCRPATALSSRPTTAAAGSWGGRPLSGGSQGSHSRPRTSWRAPGLNALERGGSAPLRTPDSETAGGAHSSPPTPSHHRAHISGAGPMSLSLRASSARSGVGRSAPPTPARRPRRRAPHGVSPQCKHCARAGSASLRTPLAATHTCTQPRLHVHHPPSHSHPLAVAAAAAATRSRPGTASRARPGTAERPRSAGRVSAPSRRPLAAAPRPLVHSSSVEDNGSQLTIGTQSVFCGTGIRALRAHKLRPDDADADEQSAQQQLHGARSDALLGGGSGFSSRGSSADGARAHPHARARGAEISSETVARERWSGEYAEILQQLKAVKLEEAWEGKDSFANMEMGIELVDAHVDDDDDARADHAGTSVPHPLRRRPGRAHLPRDGPSGRAGRAGTMSSSGGAQILSLDAPDEPSDWQARAGASAALVGGIS